MSSMQPEQSLSSSYWSVSQWWRCSPLPFMITETVLMMVLPSLVVGGLVFLFLGVEHGEYRATR